MNRMDEKFSNEAITEKTKNNLLRKSEFIDNVQFTEKGGLPLFSWVELSVIDLCNRRCVFCPRADDEVYPNQNLAMSGDLIKKIAAELIALNYEGGVVFSGTGEPLLHTDIVDFVANFGEIRTEIVTNGDKLTPRLIGELYRAGLAYMCVSMYDGPHQVEHFNEMFKEAGIGEAGYILRDRWHSEADAFGLKLGNRAGTINFGPDREEYLKKPCYYLAYSIVVDWNGDVLLCTMDWNKKIRLGNVNYSNLLSAWSDLRTHRIRRNLINGNRDSHPCNRCNTDGTFHGFNHANEWSKRDGYK